VAERLEALTDAYKILDAATGECACLASSLPFRCVRNARQYIAAQADELLAPTFTEET